MVLISIIAIVNDWLEYTYLASNITGKLTRGICGSGLKVIQLRNMALNKLDGQWFIIGQKTLYFHQLIYFYLITKLNCK